MEDWNEVVLAWLRAHPTYGVLGVGLGNVHLYAAEYIPPAYSYMYDNVFVAKSGLLRLISEIGIVGLVFALWMYWAPIWRARRLHSTPMANALFLVASVVALDFAVSWDGPLYVFLVMSFSLALRDQLAALPRQPAMDGTAHV
jgi:uncharacterized membrane protein YidH (DUF202 family)